MKRLLTGTYLKLGLFLATGAWLVIGCMRPVTHSITQAVADKPAQTYSPDEPPIESNIVRVNKYFSSEPWLNFESDGTRRIDGVRFSVYLEGAGAPKGVFGTGRLAVTLYRLERDQSRKEVANQIYEWDLPPEAAYPWRAKSRTAMGWGYGLRLHWDPKLDLAGKQIVFVVKYFREDGRVVTSSRQVLKVPTDDGAAIPLAVTAKPPSAAPVAAKPRIRRAATAPVIKSPDKISP